MDSTLSAIEALQRKLGLEFFDYQYDALTGSDDHGLESMRVCLYFRTGAGKTYTALGMLAMKGCTEAVVIAPPSTHPAWEEAGSRFGIKVHAMSHAMFRGKRTKLKRETPVIADEFHLFGGQRGQGWKKLDRLSGGLQAPLILASATPNYNDAERVYCIQHILDPQSCSGGFIAFLHQHCNTLENPFGAVPLVNDEKPFRNYTDAAQFLQALPGVFYLPDTLSYDIHEKFFDEEHDPLLRDFGYNSRTHKVMASIIEAKHTWTYNQYATMGTLRDAVWYELNKWMPHSKAEKGRFGKPDPVILFANHSTIAEAIAERLAHEGYSGQFVMVTGKDTTKLKNEKIQDFRDGKYPILIGTAALATGTDGLDKVCDTMIIVDDTDDDSLRRQLIGRIMPRGAAADASRKKVFRLLPA